MRKILLRGARTHNLKNIDLDIPRDKLIVITGISGSGKSSLAFDTLYAEGQRRYVESLSTYARQFLAIMEKPDVDHIEGLSPAIAIEQKTTSYNPRSTVGTITEIYDYLRLLFARVGEPRCPDHDTVLEAQTITQMVDGVLNLPKASKLMLLAPIVRDRKGEHATIFEQLRSAGFVRVRIDGNVVNLDQLPALNKQQKHTIEVVVDRFHVRDNLATRLAESFETAIELSGGTAIISFIDDREQNDHLFSAQFACPKCGYSISELEPRLFSFNSPSGACAACSGLGVNQYFDEARIVAYPKSTLAEGAIRGWGRHHMYYFQLISALAKHYGFNRDTPFDRLSKQHQHVILYGSGEEKITFRYHNDRGDNFQRTHSFEGVIPNMERRYRESTSPTIREELSKYMSIRPCPHCEGTRLKRASRHVFIGRRNLPAITAMPISEACDYFESLSLPGKRGKIASKILKELRARLHFLADVGLNYLSLNRSADTLSGGEAQRIRLASQIGSALVGVMYILDEPSIGLHQRDNERLLNTLTQLRDLGNTVIIVEHDEDAICRADYIVDMGPGAGTHGGHIVAAGNYDTIIESSQSLTAQYLSGKKRIAIPKQRKPYPSDRQLILKGACGNNLQSVTLNLPLGLMTCITGVSGSGKSTLINKTLYPIAATELNGATTVPPAPYDSITGLELIDKCIDINQSPIGRTPRSNPATYTGIFTPIRELFANTQEARSRGYKPGRFSFNVKGGRCEACQGDGVTKVDMHFLPTIYVPCDQCQAKRYNRETLDIHYKGKNIYEVLAMTVEEAAHFFQNIPSIIKKLQTLIDVGLAYIQLGQAATTLSGGEAQRVKLAKELSRRDTGQTLYILDEPTTGLHFHDIQQLLAVLQQLKDRGNTIVVIEHNLHVIKTADWIVDLGPEGGKEGGKIISTGAPEQIIMDTNSYTGHFLKSVLRIE